MGKSTKSDLWDIVATVRMTFVTSFDQEVTAEEAKERFLAQSDDMYVIDEIVDSIISVDDVYNYNDVE